MMMVDKEDSGRGRQQTRTTVDHSRGTEKGDRERGQGKGTGERETRDQKRLEARDQRPEDQKTRRPETRDQRPEIRD